MLSEFCFNYQVLSLFAVSLAAVSAGTALAWTSPINEQLNVNTTLPVTDEESE